jgi:glycosyltransferase involved in cell wall biosynthesis
MSVLIFHPMVAPFIQEAAQALENAGQLECFVTTVRNNPQSILQKKISALGQLMGRDFQRQFSRRAITGIPLNKVKSHPFRELLRIASGQLDKDGRITDVIWEWAETGFDRQVCQHLHPGLKAVYGYEHCSLHTFQKAKELGLKIIYELPAAEPLYAQRLFEAEIARFPQFDTPFDRYTAAREFRRAVRRQEEWKLADRVICASQFIKDTFEKSGADVSKVRIAHYGAPPPVSSETLETPAQFTQRKPHFIWCSTFSIRKGAHYLLQAWEKGKFGQRATLDVFGAMALAPEHLYPLPQGIRLMGSVPRSELMSCYQKADALIFPTLCDGFGMVATEAWSRGVPVITTRRAGVSDLLEPGQNGLLIEPSDLKSLTDALDWCLSHRPELYQMKTHCLRTAENWQWSHYRKKLIEEISFESLCASS